MFLTRDGQHFPMLFHSYELLLICWNTLMYESHFELQTEYLNFLKTELPKK
jgi:hypothetical protein